jgi:hypothetical protein
MSCLKPLADAVALDIQKRLLAEMKGLFGGIIRSYLPQRWVFVTEGGVVSLSVEKDGSVRASEGALESPDVTIETSHDRLKAAFETRERSRVPPGPLTVTAHSSKGKTAFDLLRRRIGL